ncbi:zinc finger, CCHC-type containing protein [Tanacetum coccineum]|uniref:Zinc finger, CCHC-type containing protein n=1 Tax=Tanacetum coccineum TaxID=301880 RepID=A0ABQ5FFZ5_9ASTR
MLMTMDLDIQKNLEHLGAYDMLKELKMLYVQQADQELLQTVREFHACKQEEGHSVSSYVLKMKSNIDNLERLSHAMTQNLSVSLILVSLRKEYDSFVQNYNMHSMGKTVTELHAMLKLHEQNLPPREVSPALHAIRAGRIQKNQKKKSHKAAKGNQGKGKAKMGNALVPTPSYAPKPKNPPTPKKDNPAKDAICHQCGEVGHWRRNCRIYLAELMKKKKLSQGASTSGIFTIELYSFPSTSWVYDTGCGTHICITTQGLRGSRKLKPGALSLYVGDGHRAAVEAIGEFHLFSLLYKDGFVNRFENDNSISVSKNNLIYFNAIPRDNIYEIVMSSSVTNDSSIFAVSNKRAKLNLDSALLWHCRLVHINKKRIEKLQHDGLLDSTNIKSFEKCVACMSGKMARKPYSHQVERAKDLLGLIHVNVCGPFKIMSRQGASSFVTFTDDFSRYCYLYLLKNKHEVFETFKVFQKEVENQLGKTIKSLCSDRGGEYISQEFLEHLRDHGIIAHRTPTYTPQHNASRSYVTFLILYVDDILIMGNNIPMLQDVKSYLGRCFAMKDLGEAAYILGIKIYRDRSKRIISLCQSAYIEKILKRYYMENSKRGTIPMQEKMKFSKSQGASKHAEIQRMQNIPYASAAGSIMYAVRCTRPDVAFAQNITSRFQQNPGDAHWTAVKNILKYLRNTKCEDCLRLI